VSIDVEHIMATWEQKLADDPGAVARVISLVLHNRDYTDIEAERERKRKREVK